MKRSKQQSSDAAAKLVFRNALPADWIIREQGEDIGIDFEVEVLSRNNSTGIIFKVQLKGQQDVNLISGRISQSVPTKNLSYYLYEMKIPAFILTANLAAKTVHWYAPQLDRTLPRRLRACRDGGNASLTVYIPIANKLPDSADALLEVYTKCVLVLSAENLAATPSGAFLAALEHVEVTESFVSSLQSNADTAKLQLAYSRLLQLDFAACIALVDTVLESAAATLETKFQALLYKEDAAVKIELARSSDPGEVLANVPLHFARQMHALTRRGPPKLRLFAIAATRIAYLHLLVIRDYSLFINLKIQPADQDPILLLSVVARRTSTIKRIQTVYKQAWRLLSYCVRADAVNTIPELVFRLLPALKILFLRLRMEDLRESYAALRDQCLPLVRSAIKVALATSEIERAVNLTGGALPLLDPANETDFKAQYEDLVGWVADLPAEETRHAVTKQLSDHAKLILANHAASEKATDITLAQEERLYRRMALAMGIDLEDSSDQIAQIVNIGLRDLNPERVLQNCRHLYVMATGSGIPAKILHLPSAGFKRLSCLAKHVSMESMELDSLYQSFAGEYCAGCGLSDPHPANWRWSRKWQQEQDAAHFDKFGR